VTGAFGRAMASTDHRADLVAAVRNAWETSLPRIPFDLHASWSDIGLDSLKALEFILRLELSLGRKVGFDGMTAQSTAADLLRRLGESPTTTRAYVRPLLFLVPGLLGDEPRLAQFRRALDQQLAFETLTLPDIETPVRVLRSIPATAAMLAEAVTRLQPEGDIRLVGFSFGAMVAQELACQLEARGRRVVFVAALDGLLSGDSPTVVVPSGSPSPPDAAARRNWRDCVDRAAFFLLMRTMLWEPARRVLIAAGPRHDWTWSASRRRWLIGRARGLAIRRWRPRVSSAQTLLVTSEDFHRYSSEQTWASMCPHLQVVHTPVGHHSLFDAASMAVITPRLLEAVASQTLHASTSARAVTATPVSSVSLSARVRAVGDAMKHLVLVMVRQGKERIYHAHHFLRATEGGSFERSFAAFQATPAGRSCLQSRPPSQELLKNHAVLKTYAAGSTGRIYAEFIEAYGLDEDHYLDPQRYAGLTSEHDTSRQWFRDRVETGHDLRHVLTGYGPDKLGETCLLMFRFGQVSHFGICALAVLGCVHLCATGRRHVIRSMLEAYRRGRHARLLDLLPWECELDQPLVHHRATVGLTSPRWYPAPIAPEAFSPDTQREPLDLVDTFGPMAGMHAAMDRIGCGKPCGLVVRFCNRSVAEVEAAVAAAAARFPILARSLVWQGGRPTLLPRVPAVRTVISSAEDALAFTSGDDGLLWRYQVSPQAADVWLVAVWAHAVADGGSMLRFLRAVSESLDGRAPAATTMMRRPSFRCGPLVTWLPRFLWERQLPCVRLVSDEAATPGVSWLTLPPEESERALHNASGEGFVAWLCAAASIAVVQLQTEGHTGRVCVDLPVAQGDMRAFGGFGFAASSFLIPVAVDAHSQMAALATRISARIREMRASGWSCNLDRLIGHDPRRHLRFATIDARTAKGQRLTVSWKGIQTAMGGEDRMRDIACFAGCRGVHVSAHADANGLSISLTTPQNAQRREDLLRAIVRQLGVQANALAIVSLNDLPRAAWSHPLESHTLPPDLPCMAHNPAGTKVGAASEGKNLT